MSQSLIISNFISFDHHLKPYNLGWYVSVLILYVFSILKLAFGGGTCKLFVFLFHALYIFCLIYTTWICDMFYILWAMAPCTWIEWI